MNAIATSLGGQTGHGTSAVLELSLQRHETSATEPFGAYLALREEFGDRAVYLLESLAGPAADRRSAAVGFGPLLTVSVCQDQIDVSGLPVLVDLVVESLAASGAVNSLEGLRLTSSCTLFDVPRAVERILAVPGLDSRSFGFGYLVFYGYDVVQHVEKLPSKIPAPPIAAADLTLAVYQGVALFDLSAGKASLTLADAEGLPNVDVDKVLALLSSDVEDGAAPPVPVPFGVVDSTTPEAFFEDVHTALKHIAVGDIYQVQLGHELTIHSEVDELAVYRRLRERNPSPYMAIAPVGERTMISASPELFLRIQSDEMTMRPIAGTVARTGDAATDAARKTALTCDEKEVAEHTMLVDLCRNDLSRVAVVDTVLVDELMIVEDYSHVFHLVSNVRARVAAGFDPQDVIAATFPAGTMTGAPKIRAMEIIEDLENRRRELYAGAFGLIGLGGFVNLGLCIRTLFRTGSTYQTRASAGVVADSTPDGEWRETLMKLNAAYWAVTGEELT